MTNSYQFNNKPLNNRKALITGGASGIGWAVAQRLHQQGVSVVITDINKPSKAQAEGLTFIDADVGQAADVDALFSALHKQDLLPDFLICCAGTGIAEKLTEGDPEKWHRVLNSNLMGILRCVRAFTPHMQQKGGDVVLMSSVAARKPYPWGGIYGASKAAVQAVAETLRLEVQPGIRVCSILPGVVDTGFFNNSFGQTAPDESLNWGSLSADDVADAIIYVLTRPAQVAINEMVLRPAAQVF